MRITADTNALLKAIIDDEERQQAVAQQALAEADLVVVPTLVLCELVWVMFRIYKRQRSEIAGVIRELIASASLRYDAAAVEAGLAALDGGGDFADGVIAFEGARLGGAVFVSFDRKAVQDLRLRGGEARLLTTSGLA